MATTRNPAGTWVARDGTLYMEDATNIVFSGTVALSGAFAHHGHDVSKAVKNITVTPPETSYEKLDLVGKDSNAFQDQILDEKPVGNAQIQVTLILGEDETVEDMLSGVNTAVTGGFTRRQYGQDETSTGTVAACVTLDSTDAAQTNEVSFAVDNAKISKLGDARISDTGSHWEQDITVVCLPKDFYYEFKD